jgi:hypothetical protein
MGPPAPRRLTLEWALRGGGKKLERRRGRLPEVLNAVAWPTAGVSRPAAGESKQARRSRCRDAGWQAVRVAKLHATVMCVGSLSLCMPLAVILHVWCAHAGAHEHRR